MQIQAFDVNEQGNYEFNAATLAIKPYWLTPENSSINSADPEEIEMGASASSAEIPIYTIDEGVIEISDLTCYRTYTCTVMLKDDARKQLITGRPCHVDTVFGSGTRQFRLSESLPLRKNQAILMSCTALTANATAIKPVFAGQRILVDRIAGPGGIEVRKKIVEREIRARYVLPYMCPLDEEPSMTGNDTKVYYFTQQSIAHFEVRKLTYVSTGAFKFKITDESGNQLCNDWLYSTAVLGTADYPYLLPTPWVIQAGGKVKFEIKDLSGSANTIYLTLCGRQLFVANR